MRLVTPHVRRRNHGKSPLCVCIIRIWEPDPPAGCEPVEWLLLTNHPVETSAEMRRVKVWYEWRWVVEEYHKAQKTGCAIEKRQLKQVLLQSGEAFRSDLKRIFVIILVSIPAPLFRLFASISNPVLSAWSWTGDKAISPNFFLLLGSVGIVGIFAALGVLLVLLGDRRIELKRLFLIT